jgi:hypothetical protein
MAHTEPDIAELFAPLRPAQAFAVLLSEAQQVLPHIKQPVDAELWGSDLLGALGGDAATGADLVPAAEERATPEALALLRIFSVIGSPELRATASAAAARLADSGIPDADWAAQVGAPKVGKCWHYSDVGGRQESIIVSFSYGKAEHALSVLVDHGKGGKIKDAWVHDADGLLDKTWLAAENDPLVVFETLEPAAARARLEQAFAAGECPAKPDEVDDLTAHRALLLARLRLLTSATS